MYFIQLSLKSLLPFQFEFKFTLVNFLEKWCESGANGFMNIAATDFTLTCVPQICIDCLSTPYIRRTFIHLTTTFAQLSHCWIKQSKQIENSSNILTLLSVECFNIDYVSVPSFRLSDMPPKKYARKNESGPSFHFWLEWNWEEKQWKKKTPDQTIEISFQVNCKFNERILANFIKTIFNSYNVYCYQENDKPWSSKMNLDNWKLKSNKSKVPPNICWLFFYEFLFLHEFDTCILAYCKLESFPIMKIVLFPLRTEYIEWDIYLLHCICVNILECGIQSTNRF